MAPKAAAVAAAADRLHSPDRFSVLSQSYLPELVFDPWHCSAAVECVEIDAAIVVSVAVAVAGLDAHLDRLETVDPAAVADLEPMNYDVRSSYVMFLLPMAQHLALLKYHPVALALAHHYLHYCSNDCLAYWPVRFSFCSFVRDLLEFHRSEIAAPGQLDLEAVWAMDHRAAVAAA